VHYACALLTRQPNEIANADRLDRRGVFETGAGAERTYTGVAALIDWKLLLDEFV